MNETLEDWLLTHYGKEFYRPGLERIKLALATMSASLQKSKIVIIAGTNGKGETTHRLGQLLRDFSFCSWTSPHISCITERFSSESGNISKSELEEIILEAHNEVKKCKYQLSYYEFLFFVFCRWVLIKKPKFLLLEVGLGGRFDAVNSLDASLVLLTSISRDHQEFLGNRYDKILREKLGVIRSGCQLITFLDLEYLRDITNRESQSLGVQHLDLSKVISLAPYEFSKRNQFLAYAAFCHLFGGEISSSNWLPSSEPLSFRGEILKSQNEWWFYGSHNVDGVRKLIQFLKSPNYNLGTLQFDVILASFSKRNETDVRVMLKMLKSAGLGQVVVTAINHPKGYPREELEKLAIQEGLSFVKDVSTYVHGKTHQKILVAGSYYFIGELKRLLSN